jgi:hypothetical protein
MAGVSIHDDMIPSDGATTARLVVKMDITVRHQKTAWAAATRFIRKRLSWYDLPWMNFRGL